jgi:hypothetical protein
LPIVGPVTTQNLLRRAETPLDPGRLGSTEPIGSPVRIFTQKNARGRHASPLCPFLTPSGILDAQIFIRGNRSFTNRDKFHDRVPPGDFAR